MDFRQLRYFIEIAEHGSFTKAAQTLRITQPSLGYQIKRLEAELQLRLLRRHSRGVSLTSAGQVLFEEGRVILMSMDNLQQRLSDRSAEVRGEVSVGLTPSLGERLLVPLIDQLKIAHPSLKLIVTEDLSRNLTSLIERRELDLALAYDVPLGSSLVMEKVESDPIGLAAATGDETSFGETFDFSGITEQPLVLQKRPHHMREVIERIAAREGVKLNIAFEVQSGPAVLRLVEHGLGGTITALSTQQQLWRKHRLVFRRFTRPPIIADLYLLRPAGRPASKAQKSVASLLKALLPKRSEAPILE